MTEPNDDDELRAELRASVGNYGPRVDRALNAAAARLEALRAERDQWQQECELRTEDYQRAYRRELDNAARAEKAEAEVVKLAQQMNTMTATYVTGLGEATTRAEKAEAVVEAARCIRHWHDAMSDNSGMVVSAEHVFKLWDAINEYDAALAPVEAKPCEYLDPPVCIDPSVCVSKCRFHGTVAEPHSALKGGDDGR